MVLACKYIAQLLEMASYTLNPLYIYIKNTPNYTYNPIYLGEFKSSAFMLILFYKLVLCVFMIFYWLFQIYIHGVDVISFVDSSN